MSAGRGYRYPEPGGHGRQLPTKVRRGDALGRGGQPGGGLVEGVVAEHTHRERHQETREVDELGDPVDVAHEGVPLDLVPQAGMPHPRPGLLQDRARGEALGFRAELQQDARRRPSARASSSIDSTSSRSPRR